jgi:hypothetical protein
MNQKIEIEQEKDIPLEKEFAPGFLPLLILFTLVVLVGVVVSENQVGWLYNPESKPQYSGLPLFNYFPAIYPSFVAITNVVHTYNPQLELTFTPSIIIKIGLLGSIIGVYCIIPTIFFFQWRRRRIENTSFSTISPLSFSGFSYVFSIVIIASIVAMMIMVTKRNLFSEWDQESFQEINLNRASIINELNLIQLDAYQYRILPKELGGGNGTYSGFVLSPERTKTQNGVYTVTTSDNQLTIEARSLLFSSGKIRSTTLGQGQVGAITTTLDPLGQIGNMKYEGFLK